MQGSLQVRVTTKSSRVQSLGMMGHRTTCSRKRLPKTYEMVSRHLETTSTKALYPGYLTLSPRDTRNGWRVSGSLDRVPTPKPIRQPRTGRRDQDSIWKYATDLTNSKKEKTYAHLVPTLTASLSSPRRRTPAEQLLLLGDSPHHLRAQAPKSWA